MKTTPLQNVMSPVQTWPCLLVPDYVFPPPVKGGVDSCRQAIVCQL
ncbi:hypothetical protein E2C01_072992 [Portunus trituberculatus]|uniref:Uncharacterized protein n=1 Tax=Portunus trituberculatus TaxID=210409 RepID=A0A5B7ICV3_PORTR|nr:hypothetical protein [Portunus trituberculatus]